MAAERPSPSNRQRPTSCRPRRATDPGDSGRRPAGALAAVLLLVALAEEARQLCREALAGRKPLGGFHQIDAALELLDVGGRPGIARDCFAHPLGAFLRGLLALGAVALRADDLPPAPAARQGRA